VKFIGTPPPRESIANKPCHANAPELKDETVVVNADGTLANVFVYLASAPASDGSDRPAALLDQKDCRYAPHVVAVQAGQKLRIRSSDPNGTPHNVHYVPEKNPAANFGLTTAGAEKEVTFDQAEMIRVKCDVHPWMTAYIGVFDSPFFAVTSEASGSWTIDRVPAGQYKLIAWHEQYGMVEQTVSVKENEAVEVGVTYQAP